MIPAFDPTTGALPPGDHRATLEEIGNRFGFTPRRRWLLKGLRAAVKAFWLADIEDIFIDGSFCTEKPDPGDVVTGSSRMTVSMIGSIRIGLTSK